VPFDYGQEHEVAVGGTQHACLRGTDEALGCRVDADQEMSEERIAAWRTGFRGSGCTSIHETPPKESSRCPS
jgi:hypothetical protein